jgi:hypothetical protein
MPVMPINFNAIKAVMENIAGAVQGLGKGTDAKEIVNTLQPTLSQYRSNGELRACLGTLPDVIDRISANNNGVSLRDRYELSSALFDANKGLSDKLKKLSNSSGNQGEGGGGNRFREMRVGIQAGIQQAIASGPSSTPTISSGNWGASIRPPVVSDKIVEGRIGEMIVLIISGALHKANDGLKDFRSHSSNAIGQSKKLGELVNRYIGEMTPEIRPVINQFADQVGQNVKKVAELIQPVEKLIYDVNGHLTFSGSQPNKLAILRALFDKTGQETGPMPRIVDRLQEILNSAEGGNQSIAGLLALSKSEHGKRLKPEILAEGVKFLKILEPSFTTLQGMANSILEMLRLLENVVRSNQTPESIHLNDAWPLFQSPMTTVVVGEEVKVTLDLTPNPHPISVSPLSLSQVFLSLVINARDAMERKGSLKISTRNATLTEEGPDTPQAGDYLILGFNATGRSFQSSDIVRDSTSYAVLKSLLEAMKAFWRLDSIANTVSIYFPKAK